MVKKERGPDYKGKWAVDVVEEEEDEPASRKLREKNEANNSEREEKRSLTGKKCWSEKDQPISSWPAKDHEGSSCSLRVVSFTAFLAGLLDGQEETKDTE